MKLNGEFTIKKIGDTYMLIPVTSKNVSMKSIYDMNDVGNFIFVKIKENKSFDEILQDLKKEYNASIDVLKKDLEEFINILVQKGIVIND